MSGASEIEEKKAIKSFSRSYGMLRTHGTLSHQHLSSLLAPLDTYLVESFQTVSAK